VFWFVIGRLVHQSGDAAISGLWSLLRLPLAPVPSAALPSPHPHSCTLTPVSKNAPCPLCQWGPWIRIRIRNRNPDTDS
jgi:hypothetical protein